MILALSKTKNKSIKGFTLIELLVVIAIVGILSGFIIVSLNGATASAQNARTRAGIDSIRKTILAYGIHSGGVYPTGTCSTISSTTCPLLTSALVPDYYSALPDTIYSYTSSGTDFTVSAVLSNSDTYSYTASTGFLTTPLYSSSCWTGDVGGLTCTETYDGSYVINTFTLSGTSTGTNTWNTPVGVTSVDYLVVAGGGAGGDSLASTYQGGGGGGGGVLTGTGFSVSPGTYSVTVGVGGTGGTGNNGANSVFDSITAIGGGGGSGSDKGAGNGGSGGGGRSSGDAYGTGTSGQGYHGATGSSSNGGGGGGAGEIGNTDGTGQGGDGVSSSIGSVIYGGGGGGGRNSRPSYIGGDGGGGYGGDDLQGPNAGGANTGGGGGGGGNYQWTSQVGRSGGSGIVIIKYLHP
jgi:prepilin-type N-terminal cleavage/methylation domain-containing protein